MGELGRRYKRVAATRRTSEEVTAIVQMRQAGGSDQSGGSSDCEKYVRFWMYSEKGDDRIVLID